MPPLSVNGIRNHECEQHVDRRDSRCHRSRCCVRMPPRRSRSRWRTTTWISRTRSRASCRPTTTSQIRQRPKHLGGEREGGHTLARQPLLAQMRSDLRSALGAAHAARRPSRSLPRLGSGSRNRHDDAGQNGAHQCAQQRPEQRGHVVHGHQYPTERSPTARSEACNGNLDYTQAESFLGTAQTQLPDQHLQPHDADERPPGSPHRPAQRAAAEFTAAEIAR